MSTRQETLNKNTFEVNVQAIADRLGGFVVQIFRQSESVTIPLPSNVTTAHTASADPSMLMEVEPFIPVYGRFRDDPTWDEYVQHMEQYRREIDAL